MVKLAGQGKPLPKDFPYGGFWILEPRFFLFASSEPLPDDSSTPQLLNEVNPNTAEWAIGFDARVLARAFEIEPSEIFVANSTGELTMMSGDPSVGGSMDHRILFELWGLQRTIVVRNLMASGQA